MCFTWKSKHLPISLVLTSLLLHGESRVTDWHGVVSEALGRMLTPGCLCEAWDERDCAGIGCCKASSQEEQLLCSILGEKDSVPLTQLTSRHRAGGCQVVPHLLCL